MMRLVAISMAVLLAGCASTGGEMAECAAPAQPWIEAGEGASARDAAGAGQARLAVGEAVRLALHPDGEVIYLTLPQGEGEAASFGGLASFAIARAGVYVVGVDRPSWIDVVRDGAAVDTVRHGRAPACSGIRKEVAFRLEPGAYTLELSGSEAADIGVLIRPDS